jgi:trigger factor
MSNELAYDLHVEELSTSRRRFTLTVGPDVVKSELDRAFLKLKNEARLPGFRPGKVPRNVLEARFGRQIRAEVGANLVDRAWRQVSRDVPVAGQPLLESQEDLAPTGFSFTIAVDVKPEVAASGYRGIEVSYKSRTVSDEAVEAAIQRKLQSKAKLTEVVDGRAVEIGDFVLTSLKLEADGAVVVEEPGTLVNTRGDRFYPGLESLLVGLSVGGTASGSVSIGASQLAHLKGKSFEASVSVIAVQSYQAPALDDSTAQDLGYEGGVDAMRGAIRMELETEAQEADRTDARVALLQKLVDAHSFDVPDGLVDEQYQALVEEMRVRRAYAGQDARSIRFSDAELADLRNRARFAARAAILLASIAKQEGLQVTDADLDKKIAEISQMRGQTVAAIRGYLEREKAMPVLRDRIQEEKTLEWLLDNAELQPTAE